MAALAGLAILHGCIAAVFIEALMRAWHVRAPGLRLALRFVALIAPFVSLPLAALAAPLRASFAFQEHWVVYAGSNWDNIRVATFPVSTLATVVLSLAGALLFARDTLPFLADRVRRPSDDDILSPSHPASARLATALGRQHPPGAPPALITQLIHANAAVLYCSGVEHPVLTISTGTLDRLEDDELRAAVSHELEHAHRRDPAMGWVLMAIRALQAFNPATQIVGRQVVEEIEHRADRAVAARGLAAPLASAIASLSASEPHAVSDLAAAGRRMPLFSALAKHAAAHATMARCERLLLPDAGQPRPGIAASTALAAAGLAALLLFVG